METACIPSIVPNSTHAFKPNLRQQLYTEYFKSVHSGQLSYNTAVKAMLETGIVHPDKLRNLQTSYHAFCDTMS